MDNKTVKMIMEERDHDNIFPLMPLTRDSLIS